MSDIVERLRAMTRCEHDDLTIAGEAADEIEKLRKAIRGAIKLADLDAIKSFRKTLLWALGEKE